jgi:hypothetical protein
MSCHELKEGDTLVCDDCGLELKVTKACNCSEEGACTEGGFDCCGMAMKKK